MRVKVEAYKMTELEVKEIVINGEVFGGGDVAGKCAELGGLTRIGKRYYVKHPTITPMPEVFIKNGVARVYI